jgi:hypothetical protein
VKEATLNAEIRQFAEPILATLRQALSVDQLEAALARGQARQLEDVVDQVLGEVE